MNGGRKALLIGINYVGSQNALQVSPPLKSLLPRGADLWRASVKVVFCTPFVHRGSLYLCVTLMLVDLQGCHQDVHNMKDFLISQGWYEGDMVRRCNARPRPSPHCSFCKVVLTDEPYVNPNSPGYPTGQNILRAMRWLIDRAENHSLFLHYSGHGGQVQAHS
jgi:hypothetical protein